MEYTKKERKAIAKAFRAAKKHLWDGCGESANYSTICYSIEAAMSRDQCSRGGGYNAKGVVMGRLGDSCTVVGWLIDKRFISGNTHNGKTVQEYRHRWLDALIKEFSK